MYHLISVHHVWHVEVQLWCDHVRPVRQPCERVSPQTACSRFVPWVATRLRNSSGRPSRQSTRRTRLATSFCFRSCRWAPHFCTRTSDHHLGKIRVWTHLASVFSPHGFQVWLRLKLSLDGHLWYKPSPQTFPFVIFKKNFFFYSACFVIARVQPGAEAEWDGKQESPRRRG